MVTTTLRHNVATSVVVARVMIVALSIFAVEVFVADLAEADIAVASEIGFDRASSVVISATIAQAWARTW